MDNGEFRFVPQPLTEKLVDMAEHISKFKTKEMELAFAEFLIRVNNPRMYWHEKETSNKQGE